jgi:hypothetical protein
MINNTADHMTSASYLRPVRFHLHLRPLVPGGEGLIPEAGWFAIRSPVLLVAFMALVTFAGDWSYPRPCDIR